MSRIFLAVILLCSIALTTTGCGSPRSERPKAKASLLDSWPEGKTFLSETGYTVFSLEGEWKQMIPALKDPAFKTGLDEFAASEIPADFESKKAAKDKLVETLNTLIAEANGSADRKTIETTYKDVSAALKELNGT